MRDTFSREITYLRLSITELCNLRCRYCMTEEGVCKKSHEEMLTEDETVSAVRAAASLGVRKLRITGGEPLIKKNIVSICRRCGEIDGIDELCITTNGILLPQLASLLKDAGVSRLNISLDTLDPDKYRYITRGGELKDAVNGIKAAFDAGFEGIKINTVLVGGFNDDEVPSLAELTVRYPIDLRFIELMPMEGNRCFGKEAYIPCSHITNTLPGLVPEAHRDGVARMFRLPGAVGRIGLINPVSDHFCKECNRIRLTADGKIKPCLHSSAEFPIKGKTESEMLEVFKQAIQAKPEWHGELNYASISNSGREMNRIGG